MKITRLDYKNFKGQSNSIEINRSILLSGANGVGKTTAIDAPCWCLFGKFSDRTESSPKPRDSDNKVVTCDVMVELHTDVGRFKRVYSEIWKTPRGKINQVFGGHETKYYLDGVKVLAREFEAAVAELFTEDQFYIAAVPTYFGTQLHWKLRRQFLSEMIGDPDHRQLIAREPDLEEILIEGKNSLYYETMLKSKKTDLKQVNQDRQSLPDRIDELFNFKKDTQGYSLESLAAEIKDKQDILENGVDDRALMSAREAYQELRRQSAESHNQLLSEQLQHCNTKLDKVNKRITELHDERRGKINLLNQLRDDLRKNNFNVNSLNDSTTKKLLEKKQLQDTKNAYEIDLEKLPDSNGLEDEEMLCSLCGQILPQEILKKNAEKREKYYEAKANNLRELIANSEEKLKGINSELNSDKKMIETLQKNNNKLQKEIEVATHNIIDCEETIEASEKEVDNARALLDKKHKQEREENKASYDKLLQEAYDKMIALQESSLNPEETKIKEEINRLEQIRSNILNNKEIEERIKDLEIKNKALSAKAEELLREVYLYELRLKTWALVIESQLNEKFKMAKFKLFDIQVNGEVKEVCEVLFNGKTTMSQGEEIYVGIDVSEAFSKHWGIDPPILIDGVQNITFKLEFNRQSIQTKTTEDHDLSIKEIA